MIPSELFRKQLLILFYQFLDFILKIYVFSSIEVSILLRLAPKGIELHSFTILLLNDGLQLLLIDILFVPESVGLFVFTFDEDDVFIFLLESSQQGLLLILVVNDALFISAHALGQLSFAQSHFCVAIRQKVLKPFIIKL